MDVWQVPIIIPNLYILTELYQYVEAFALVVNQKQFNKKKLWAQYAIRNSNSNQNLVRVRASEQRVIIPNESQTWEAERRLSRVCFHNGLKNFLKKNNLLNKKFQALYNRQAYSWRDIRYTWK